MVIVEKEGGGGSVDGGMGEKVDHWRGSRDGDNEGMVEKEAQRIHAKTVRDHSVF